MHAGVAPGRPAIGPSVPRRGNALSLALGRAALACLRWRVEGEIPDVSKVVAIVAPHTSNWDFVVGLAAMLALGLRVEWLGKGTLFRPPFGALLRWLGGIPVDRSAADGVVDAAVDRFREKPTLFLGLAPEGTRKKVERWKSGFHRIARRAGVPILLVSLDYRLRVLGLGPLFTPTEDFEADLAALRSRFASGMARNPESF